MKPQDCPNFQTCNSSICPKGPEWPGAAHLPGEKVCPYLLSSGKAGAAEHFANDPVFAECLAVLGPIRARHRDVARRIDKAARSGIKVGRFRKKEAPGQALAENSSPGGSGPIYGEPEK
jgi:hypothetical protein